VGIISAQSIGEPGTQLTMRTFHIGGIATAGSIAQSSHQSKQPGRIKFQGIVAVQNREKNLVAMNRNGYLVLLDENHREREKYQIPYGAILMVADGDKVKEGTRLAEWDPYNIPILTEVAGEIKFGDIIENVTMREQVDEVTGRSTRVIIDSKDTEVRPRISLKEVGSRTTRKLPGSSSEARYLLPSGSNILVDEGQKVQAGDIIAKIPRETTKTKDITGGLPRVAELFEARKPKEYALISEIDGIVQMGKDFKGKRKILVVPEVGVPRDYTIPRGKHITVHDGERIRAGEALMDGSPNPHDILRVLGDKELARFLVNEIQEVYRLQGVRINDKHIETIVRQMLRRIKIMDSGDTSFLVGQSVEKWIFREENERVKQADGKPATAEPLLLGITKASLSTESWISAASFQETTKILTDASVHGRVDFLAGLKENVIMGRLIPGGTGAAAYKAMDFESDAPLVAEAPPLPEPEPEFPKEEEEGR
jgi:DNA-directed RNA polymerase subunit beta'